MSYHNEHVDLEQPEGTSNVLVSSVDPVDHIFDQFLVFLGHQAFVQVYFSSSDSDAKKLKREVGVTGNSKFKAMRNIFCLMQKSRNIAPLCSTLYRKVNLAGTEVLGHEIATKTYQASQIVKDLRRNHPGEQETK